ncbi:MAG: hypothetical protein JXJ04_15270 [Spirochaetales bacterium]|nr:hypothetical protein [Spirochaetales bacterium]
MSKQKIFIFDIDGVLIRVPHYYSLQLEKEGYPHAVRYLSAYYGSPENDQCLMGKADIKDVIIPFLNKFHWDNTADEYIHQQFQFEIKYVDKQLISFIQKLRKEHYLCFIGTDQERIRAGLLSESMNFSKNFDGSFISYNMGFRKCHDRYWEHVQCELKRIADMNNYEILFFDDIQTNIDVAIKNGIKGFLFTDITKFVKDISSEGIEICWA